MNHSSHILLLAVALSAAGIAPAQTAATPEKERARATGPTYGPVLHPQAAPASQATPAADARPQAQEERAAPAQQARQRQDEPDPSARPAPQPEQRREDPAYDDHDDRDHRKSGWSLFGRGKRQQPAQPTYAPQTRTTEMRSTSQVQPTPEPDQGQAEDDMEIPSFLRRLAN